MLSLGTRMLDQRGQPPAVIVIDSVAVQSGPSRDYLTEFTLHAGAEVRIVEQRKDWARIVLPGELQGWVPVAAIEEV
jgi:SH3-like domain-containing protein